MASASGSAPMANQDRIHQVRSTLGSGGMRGVPSIGLTPAAPDVSAHPSQVPWENQNMHCIVTVYGCAVHIDNSNELD